MCSFTYWSPGTYGVLASGMTEVTTVDLAFEELSEHFGTDWRIWRSGSGRLWCATRLRPLSPLEMVHEDLAATLIMNSPEELATALEQQQGFASGVCADGHG